MSVLVRVEHVRDREFPDRQDYTIIRLIAGELVDVAIDLLRFSSETKCLTEKGAGNPGVWRGGADLVGLAAREARDAEGRTCLLYTSPSPRD